MNTILIEQTKSLIDTSLPNISNLANIIALLFHEMDHINWLGFYICDNAAKECTLGPFQGKVACTRIPYGKGVVGTCAQYKQTQRVDNVHTFAGHIACDSDSNSEICIPIQKNGTLYAIFDIDSFKLNNFTKEDQQTLEEIADIITQFFDNK